MAAVSPPSYNTSSRRDIDRLVTRVAEEELSLEKLKSRAKRPAGPHSRPEEAPWRESGRESPRLLFASWPVAKKVEPPPRDRMSSGSGELSPLPAVGSEESPRARSSLYYGVSWNSKKRKWVSQYTTSTSKTIYVGQFEDEVAAALAYNEAVCDAGLSNLRTLNQVGRDGRLAEKPDTSSAYWSVSWSNDKQAWHAKPRHSSRHGGDGKRHFLGQFDSETTAALAVDKWILEICPGLVAKRNFPDMSETDLLREFARLRTAGPRGRTNKCRTCGQPKRGHPIICPLLRCDTKRDADADAPPRKKRKIPPPPVHHTQPATTRPRLWDQPVPSTREERMLAIAASPSARALFRIATAARSRKS